MKVTRRTMMAGAMSSAALLAAQARAQACLVLTGGGTLTVGAGTLCGLPAVGGFDGAIAVSGNKLVNGAGSPIQLRGANMSGMENSCIQGGAPWGDDGGVPKWSVYQTWRPNVVRIPLNSASWAGVTPTALASSTTWGSNVSQSTSAATYIAAVDAAIAAAQAIGCYVILDLHWECPPITLGGVTHNVYCNAQNAMASASVAIAFWTALANRYGTQATPQPGISNAGIIFEGFNEPFMQFYPVLNSVGGTIPGSGDAPQTSACMNLLNCTSTEFECNTTFFPVTYTWTLASHQAILNAIRGTGAHNVYLASNLTWAQELSFWLTYKLTDNLNQVAAAWHPYPNGSYPYSDGDVYGKIGNDAGGGTSSFSQWAQAILTAGYPVVITEDGGRGGTGATSGEPHITYMAALADSMGMSYLNWQWNGTQAFGTSNTNNFLTAFASNGTTILPIAGQGQAFYNWIFNHA